jgi:inorganic phosphate transporter, PiT family
VQGGQRGLDPRRLLDLRTQLLEPCGEPLTRFPDHAGDIIVVLAVAVALVFDFTTANAMATTIATGALKPPIAVGVAAMPELRRRLHLDQRRRHGGQGDRGPRGRDDDGDLRRTIAWNLVTWWFGVPSSSSHGLIGGMIWATIAAVRTSGVEWDGVTSKVLGPALIAPVLAGLVALGATVIVYRLIRNSTRDRAERGFRWAQIASSSMVALAHGTNDAQKTMGVISPALIANGNISGGPDFDVPTWVVVSCGLAIALGSYAGGWRIIKTLGTRCARRRASPPRRSRPRSSSPPPTSATRCPRPTSCPAR